MELVSVVVVVVDSVIGAGVVIAAVGAGVLTIVVFVVVLVSVECVSAGDGFTIVVLFSVFSAGEAAGVTVSVFCSHAVKSAALARMQMYFFIIWMIARYCGRRLNRSNPSFWSYRSSVPKTLRSGKPSRSIGCLVRHAMGVGHRFQGQTAIAGVDAALQRRLFLTRAFEAEIGEQLHITRGRVA